jgi:transposase
MQAVTTIGLDIAKSVFQVHGIDTEGRVLIRRKLKRRYVLAFFQKLQPCLVGIEACATSHHWSRELKTLGIADHGESPGGVSYAAINSFGSDWRGPRAGFSEPARLHA